MHRLAMCIALLISCAGVCPAAPQSGEDVRWLEVRSPHFSVICNADERLARGTATQFEQFREVFRQAMPGLRVDSGTPLVILALKDEKSLRAVLPENWGKRSLARTRGYFLRGLGKNYAVLRTDVVGDGPYHVIYHEYAHSLMNLNYGVVPLWLSEGLAEFFGHTVINSREALIGVSSANELALLRKTELLPLATLFAVDYTSPYYSEDNKTAGFYAQSWALTHFLMVSDQGARRPQIAQFLHLLDQDVPTAEAAERAFGDIAVLSRQLDAYIHQKTISSVRVPARAASNDASYVVREIPVAESLAIRADILLHNDRFAEARKLLADALWLNPDLPLANESMGFLLFRQGDRAGAEKWFASAAELDSQNALAHYYHALALAREGEDIGDFEATEKHLRRAIQLNPDFALAYSMLALAYAAHDARLEEALRLARHAVELEPGTLEHQLRVGSVLLRMDRVEGAQHIAQRVRAAAKTEEDRVAATDFLEQIRKFQELSAQKEKYEAQVSAEQKALDERRLQRTAPPADPPQRATPLGSPADANAATEGVIVDVVCSGTSVLDLTVSAVGASIMLHSENFLRIEYSGSEWQPPKDFQPCKHLAGLHARVTYRLVSGQSFAGIILAIEVKK
jgi:tetratricopeptide (TPR) repeat protein